MNVIKAKDTLLKVYGCMKSIVNRFKIGSFNSYLGIKLLDDLEQSIKDLTQ